MKILPIWQPVGMSTHLISQRVAEKFNTKTSHTGTLDPMAEGVIIVLLGDERLKKKEYAKWPKTYEFIIIFGISTDSYDGMGLITALDFTNLPNKKAIKDTLASLEGPHTPQAPPLSTKKIKGKHLHEHFRSGEPVKLPEIKGEIYKLELLEFKEQKRQALIESIIKDINLVTGDFRQEEIIKNWNQKLPKKLKTVKILAETSKGLYIRSLSQIIAEKLKTKGVAYKIVRTKNGNYSSKNSQTLEQTFGKNYKKVYDFHSKHKLTVVK